MMRRRLENSSSGSIAALEGIDDLVTSDGPDGNGELFETALLALFINSSCPDRITKSE